MFTDFQTSGISPVPNCSKIIEGDFGMTSAAEDSQRNPIGFHKSVGILLEQQIAHNECTLIPSEYVGTEPISIAGVTRGSQELTLLEAEVSLTGKEWQKHPIVTGSGAPCILGIDFLRNGYYKDSKGLRWAFGIAAVEAEGIKKWNILPELSENPSAVGLLKVEEQRVPVVTSTVHRRQYRTNRDALIPIHKVIRELESQGVVSKTHSPFNSPV
ncbi:hypothetical protein DUI87_22318 [Hirundo rustica rustica]|uniref:Reverse transcriptase/retrotransposon-derived protein RNase H-like domain-containing protein n=1 Tax=Hirundo rustica rustica TaxID=333673 RepID=A0A3M0JPR4_HIRRU|nr:hypothetical protein DUI87_22318 [Hirundo rustica rustica]